MWKWIVVCDRWDSFTNFLEDMESSFNKWLELDRIDNDKWYSKENCRWATKSENAKNRSTTKMISFNWKTQCLNDWAKEIWIKSSTIWHRIKSWWSIEKSLTKPLPLPLKQ